MTKSNSKRRGTPEAPAAITARGRNFRERQEAEGRSRWEIYVTLAEREAIKKLLSRLRT